MRNVDLKAILKPILELLKKFRKSKQKTSTITVINKGNIVINVSEVKDNVSFHKD